MWRGFTVHHLRTALIRYCSDFGILHIHSLELFGILDTIDVVPYIFRYLLVESLLRTILQSRPKVCPNLGSRYPG